MSKDMQVCLEYKVLLEHNHVHRLMAKTALDVDDRSKDTISIYIILILYY